MDSSHRTILPGGVFDRSAIAEYEGIAVEE
jgi:hypothetical protein